ncbi:MAG TPA: TonB-dependent receptor [Bacteroidales bacterium]|nr:TonB-dependent receptor [Bacteroidales bacterium]
MNTRKTLITISLQLCFFIPLFAQDIIVLRDSLETPEIDIEEIIVSASKDQSTYKKMPVSVSFISNTTIQSNEIQSLNQVSSIAANFVMPDYGSKLTSPVYIRGIGSRINSPSVGLYVDQVPYFEKAAFDFDFFDIERIEILRGPQGTLYGRNSMGGLINIQTLSPENYQGANINISAANYGNYKLGASYYAKANQKLAYSLSGNYNQGDGFYTNTYLNSQVDEFYSAGLRGKIIYNLTDQLRIENIANFDQVEQGGYPYAIFNDSLQIANDINYNQPSSYNRLLFSDGLKINYIGNNWKLDNTLSYQLLDDKQKIDQDFTPDSLYFVEQAMKQNMISDELIIRSTNNKRYNWLFGAFGFMQIFDKSVEADLYSANMWYIKNYNLNVMSFALFHQSTFQLTPMLLITAGIRYDYETSELNYKYRMERGGAQMANTDTTYNKLTDLVLLPKLAISYQLNKSTVYVTYTTGYKPGGFNSTFEEPEQLQFKHENSHNYEIGLKTSVFNRFLFTDIAGFYTVLKNQQIYRTVPSGRGSYLDNAGLSENKGFEIALKNREIKGFQANVSYGYTHSRIIKYEEDSITNYNNQFTPYIPRHTLAIQLNQIIKIEHNTLLDELRINATFQQQGKTYWNLDNSYYEDAYHMLNAKISLIKNKFQFDIWARNILNTQYRSFLFEALGNTYVQMGKPFQVGVNVSVKF